MRMVRAGYGVVLLIAPQATLDRVWGHRCRPAARRAVRVLGLRHVVQAVALPTWSVVGGAVDLLHAASMAGLALRDARDRRAAILSAILSGALAADARRGGCR